MTEPDMADDSQQTTETSSTEAPAQPSGPVVAHYDRWYRGKRLVVYGVMFIVGIWSIYHGFYLYPKENREWDPTHSAKPPHSQYDAPINKAMGILLPPVGLYLIIRLLRASSSDIRLEGETLYGPHHPPVPLSAIRRIDKRKWDYKGIAHLEYELGEPPQMRRFLLDSYLYEQQPIEEILRRIEKFAGLEEPQPQQPASEQSSA